MSQSYVLHGTLPSSMIEVPSFSMPASHAGEAVCKDPRPLQHQAATGALEMSWGMWLTAVWCCDGSLQSCPQSLAAIVRAFSKTVSAVAPPVSLSGKAPCLSMAWHLALCSSVSGCWPCPSPLFPLGLLGCCSFPLEVPAECKCPGPGTLVFLLSAVVP